MDDHIAFALQVSGADAGQDLADETQIAAALRADEIAWLHLSADHPDTPGWIATHLSYLDPAIRDALTRSGTRPRALAIGDGLMINLRGINLDPDGNPEDMVSLRLWIDQARVISVALRRLVSVESVAASVRTHKTPDRAGAILCQLIEQLTQRIEAQVGDLDDRAEALEAAIIADPRSPLGAEVSDQRLELTDLRLFLGPQRDALRAILDSRHPWLTERDRTHLGELHDRMIRVVETLEATRDQLQTMRDELSSAANERLNKRLYVLSIISAVFLPLGFLTGLMGINLAGMPGASWEPAFWVFTGLLVAAALGVLALLRWIRML